MGEFSRRGGLSAPCRQTGGINDTFLRNFCHGILGPQSGTKKFRPLGTMMFFAVMVVIKTNMERKRGEGIKKSNEDQNRSKAMSRVLLTLVSVSTRAPPGDRQRTVQDRLSDYSIFYRTLKSGPKGPRSSQVFHPPRQKTAFINWEPGERVCPVVRKTWLDYSLEDWVRTSLL